MQQVLLKCKGLYSFPSHLSAIPAGALLVARNIIIQRDEVAESRRGFKIYGTAMGSGSSTTAHQLLNYKQRILRHYGTAGGTTLEYDNGSGTFTGFTFTITATTNSTTTVTGFTTTSTLSPGMNVTGSGIPTNTTIASITNNTTIVLSAAATTSVSGVSLTFSVVIAEASTGTRIKGIEQNGNFYFTTSDGIKKISASSASGLGSSLITPAGGVKALDLSLALNTQTGFLLQESAVAYRIVWGIKDANNNLVLGAPSNRAIIYNPLSSLLTTNFNALLANLDTVSNSGGINAANYVSTLKLPSTTTPAALRTGLISLATKIDADTIITEGVIDSVTSQRVSATQASIIFSASVATFLEVGDVINLTGSGTAELNNNRITITSVSTTTVVGTPATNYAATDGAPVGDVLIAAQRLKYSLLTTPGALSTVPTTAQLLALQVYYDLIVTNLQGELTGIITTGSQFNNSNSTQSATTNVTFTIPRGITTTHFYQIYRTAIITSTGALTLSSLDPGDEEQLVYEANPTNANLTAGSITVQDITPDSFRGANLYTNSQTGEGIAQANDVPPIAKDVVNYKNYTFYANTQTKQRSNLSLLGVVNFVSGTSSITVTDGTTTNNYTFVHGLAQTQTITTVADVADSLNGDYFYIYNANNVKGYYVWFKTSGGAVTDPAVAGFTSIRIDISTGATNAQVATALRAGLNQNGDFFTSVSANVVTVTNTSVGISTACSNGASSPGFTYATTVTGQGEDVANKKVLYTPVINGIATAVTAASPAAFTSTSHGLTTGMLIQVSGSNGGTSVDGLWPVTVTGANGFTIPIDASSGAAATYASWALSPIYSPAQQVEQTAKSLVKVINQNASDIIYGSYLSGPADVPGLLLLESRTLSQSTVYFLANNSATGTEFNLTLAPTNSITGISIANPTVVTSAAHGLATGTQIVISGSDSTPSINGMYTITSTGTNTFTIPVNVTGAGTTGSWIVATAATQTSNEIRPNRIYYSKVLQPDAVPLTNYFDVGPKDKAVIRILALRESLFIIKEDGIYRLTGSNAPFNISLTDASTIIRGADTAVVLNNLIYCYSNQGVVQITDSGVQIMSHNIEDLVVPISSAAYTNFNTASFAVSYETDRSYYFFTVTETTDTYATQCFRYNTITNSWTQLMLSKRSGLVNSADDKLYLGAGDTNYLEQERKSFDRTDYADREYSITLASSAVSTTTITLPSVTNVTAMDSIVQTQYLTILQYNQLLSKLDNDSTLTDNNYVSLLTISPGVVLNTALDTLITKVSLDAGRVAKAGSTAAGTYTALTPASADFATLQTTFNSFITLLNSDTGLGYGDYVSSTGTVSYEFNVVSVDSANSTITSPYTYPLLTGPITAYAHIRTDLQWVPQYLTDTSITKQVSEATVIFEDNSFTAADVAFSTDVSGNFETQTIAGSGNGLFGNIVYGNGIYGGNGNATPLRTYVPQQKQKCRYINLKVTHKYAREKYYLYGCSLSYHPMSNRGFR